MNETVLDRVAACTLVREKRLLGDKKANPPIPAILPISHSTLWKGIKEGRYPPPIKLGPRISAWPLAQMLAIARGEPWK